MTRFVLVIIAMLLGACALSPQEIQIDPTLSELDNNSAIVSSPFNLRVIDQRESNILGKRGGVYKDTAIISTDAEMVERLQATLIERFSSAGYLIDELAEHQLYVMIDQLSYEAIGETRVSEVIVAAEITATAATGTGNFSKKYKASHTQQVLKAPGDEKNIELVNNVFGAVMQRVLNDAELLQYLDN